MTRNEFLEALRSELAGLPQAEIDEAIADYDAHFEEGLASGRSEEDIAAALGNPERLGKELRAEIGLRRWETARTPGNFLAVMAGFLALIAMDFIVLLPVLAILAFFALVAGLVATLLCLIGLGLIINLFQVTTGFFGEQALLRILSGLSMLGFGIGGGALLILLMDLTVRALGRFARLHYTLLNQAEVTS